VSSRFNVSGLRSFDEMVRIAEAVIAMGWPLTSSGIFTGGILKTVFWALAPSGEAPMARIKVSAAAPRRLHAVDVCRSKNRLKTLQRTNLTKEQNADRNGDGDGQSHEFFKDEFSGTSRTTQQTHSIVLRWFSSFIRRTCGNLGLTFKVSSDGFRLFCQQLETYQGPGDRGDATLRCAGFLG
jgi:hypothetical protein